MLLGKKTYSSLFNLSFALVLSACSGGNENSDEDLDLDDISTIDSSLSDSETEFCNGNLPVQNKSNFTVSSNTFGDGSDGEILITNGETFVIDQTQYNFSNFYAEADSLLLISNNLANSAETIEINSLGICNFLGDIDFSNFDGDIKIHCGGEMNLGGIFLGSTNGKTVLTSNSFVINSSFDPSNVNILFSGTSPNASISFTGGEFNSLVQTDLPSNGDSVTIGNNILNLDVDSPQTIDGTISTGDNLISLNDSSQEITLVLTQPIDSDILIIDETQSNSITTANPVIPQVIDNGIEIDLQDSEMNNLQPINIDFNQEEPTVFSNEDAQVLTNSSEDIILDDKCQ